jgi:hypothetical protein
MKMLLITTLVATALFLVSGCDNGTTAKTIKSDAVKSATSSKPKSADEEFDAKFLKNVRTVTKIRDLEMELYRKAARKTLAQLEEAGGMAAANSSGIASDDYKKMVVEGLIKEMQGKLRSARRDLRGEAQQKALLQSIINAL